jgi:hypothetical protein
MRRVRSRKGPGDSHIVAQRRPSGFCSHHDLGEYSRRELFASTIPRRTPKGIGALHQRPIARFPN